MDTCPIRLDFAGGWLDVPSLELDGYIVNCTFSPLVSLTNNPYQHALSGLGGSAIVDYLEGKNSIATELERGAGWQDPAIIQETGLCVWKSGARPKLVMKINPEFLFGKIAVFWIRTKPEFTCVIRQHERNYKNIQLAGELAYNAVKKEQWDDLWTAIELSYQTQIAEGMEEIKTIGNVKKYCGAGWGGWAMQVFPTKQERDESVKQGAIAVEPFMNFY